MRRQLFLALLVGAHTLIAVASHSQPSPDPKRRTVGVAFGGGSAKGFAHIGVIRWFEEHHIPIDFVAGTSMGGLVGGAYAAGMSSAELAALARHTDWNEMFGGSSYRYKSIRRKNDARDYPSRLEFHLRRGFALPSALNNGLQVDLLLSHIGAVHAGLPSFDSLPTPFRSVAVDLYTAKTVVFDSGSLPRAMRATMSLPGIFPPVEVGDYLLVDGGAMDNVPADVARTMGADVVIAVNVGSMAESRPVDGTLFGLVNSTMDAMMRASTRRGIAAADIIVNPVLEGFSGMDWRRASELAEEGYRATEAKREQLLPLAVDDATWRQYQAQRAARRRTKGPVISAIEIVGAAPEDERAMRRRLSPQLGKPLDIRRLEDDVELFGGLDRYQSVGWDLAEREGRNVLIVRAYSRRTAPPLMMFTMNVQNLTSDEFTFQLAARLLSFDVLTPGAELRVDLALGTNSHVAAEWRDGVGRSPFFVAPYAGALLQRMNFVRENAIVAQYDESRAFGGLDLGVTPSRYFELRGGIQSGYYRARVRVGDPGLPSLDGLETQVRLRGTYDTQNSPVVPSSGIRVVGIGRYVIAAPELPASFPTSRTDDGLTQAEIGASNFWSWRERRERVFVVAQGGSSFGGEPLPAAQFVAGLPLRLDAFEVGERRGDNFATLSVGYLHAVGRLPDFLGGSLFVGTWLENGTIFDSGTNAKLITQMGLGGVVETLVGPALVGYSFGGASRFYVAFGRLWP
jgi:NTE family protein